MSARDKDFPSCRLNRDHSWNQWEDEAAGDMVRRESGRKSVVGRYVYQNRTCLICGVKQLRKETVYFDDEE